MPKLPVALLIDNENISRRAWHATNGGGAPDAVLLSYNGFPTNAISAWGGIVATLLRNTQPDRVIFCFDGHAKARKEMYPEYKAGREGLPEPLKKQLPVIRQLTEKLGFEYVHNPDEEADDVIVVLAESLGRDHEVVIASGDKDFAQCINARVSQIKPLTGGVWKRFGPLEVQQEYGVSPSQFATYLALMGDDVDNIPGFDGIAGGKAAKLLSGDPDSATLLARLAKMTKMTPEKAAEHLKFNLALTTARTNIDASIQRSTAPIEEGFELFAEYGCATAISRLTPLLLPGSKKADMDIAQRAAPAEAQMSLF
jgi:DNA polymerase-1